ncbi:sensor domain-containing protein [Pseudomonas benzenivorans]|uniref:Diguanylate cyclase n=1 Tax=Pseudomonas benzenivorans TaxID=556533 RepID=A0ABY5HBW9_9PSED|nr:diguanylate cyclase [Pseudomonas benzenivorans]UTW09093.1 diguanylate cyclase [Pseudomonas benzenivorans]
MDRPPYSPPSAFIDLLLDAVCVVDAEGRFVFVSAACERIFGYSPQEMIGRPMIEMVAPEDRARTLQAADEIMAGQAKPHFENRYLRKDGKIAHIMWSARWSEADQLRIAVARDITERKQAESLHAALYAISEAAHTAEDLLALFRQIHQIIGALLPAQNFSVALYDASHDRLSFPYHVDEREQASTPRCSAADALCAEVIHSERALLLTPETQHELAGQLQPAVDPDALCWLGVPLNSPDGAIGALALKSYRGGALYSDQDKELLQFVSNQVAAAIERNQLHARLRHMAQYDQLTQLPNRGLLHDRLRTALARARRETGRMALLYLDLDNFKQINDSLGHAAGDLLLQEVASRLKLCVRDADTVARIGGDEFVVLLESIQVPAHAAALAEKIRELLNQPMDLAGHALCILPSIGIALYPEHGDTMEQLLKHADDAMYGAKSRGGNRIQLRIRTGPDGDDFEASAPA